MFGKIKLGEETHNLFFKPFVFAMPHGRGAGASTACARAVVYGLRQEEEIRKQPFSAEKMTVPKHLAQDRSIVGNAVIVCKDRDFIEWERPYYRDAINVLGVEHDYRWVGDGSYFFDTSTEQRIYFTTQDEYMDVFSDISTRKLHVRFLVTAQTADLPDHEFFQDLNERFLNRSAFKINTFCLAPYNVPPSKSHWANKNLTIRRNGAMFMRMLGTCFTMDKGWVGESFFQEARYLSASNKKAYLNEYMGKAVEE